MFLELSDSYVSLKSYSRELDDFESALKEARCWLRCNQSGIASAVGGSSSEGTPATCNAWRIKRHADRQIDEIGPSNLWVAYRERLANMRSFGGSLGMPP